MIIVKKKNGIIVRPLIVCGPRLIPRRNESPTPPDRIIVSSTRFLGVLGVNFTCAMSYFTVPGA